VTGPSFERTRDQQAERGGAQRHARKVGPKRAEGTSLRGKSDWNRHGETDAAAYIGNAVSLTQTCPYIAKVGWVAYDSDATHLTLHESLTPASGVRALTLTKQ
jgi:hypothetical protein